MRETASCPTTTRFSGKFNTATLETIETFTKVYPIQPKHLIFRTHGQLFFNQLRRWIFRYVLEFLRTGDLPQDQALLQEMYVLAV